MSKIVVVEAHFINGNKISDKGYRYNITKEAYTKVYNSSMKLYNGPAWKPHTYPCFHIKNQNGYDYRKSPVVILKSEVVENFGEVEELVKIVDAEYIGEFSKDTSCQRALELKEPLDLLIDCNRPAFKPTSSTGLDVVWHGKPDVSIVTIKDEKENSMFENVFKNVKFGKADSVNMSIYGPAFPSEKNGKSYISYHDEQWVDVTGLLLDMNFCYMMPVAKDNVNLEDYILHNDRWVRVIDIDEAGRLIVEKLESQEVVTILPTTNVFGFDFYTKLFTPNEMLGGANCGASVENPFGMLPMMMMMQDESSRGNDSMMKMFMMASMMSGNTSFNPMMLMLMGDHKSSDMKDFMMMSMMMGNNPFDMNVNK